MTEALGLTILLDASPLAAEEGTFKTLLTILKYSGLLVAALASIWGAVSSLTSKRRNRQLRLYVAVSLTILFMFISIGSNVLEDRERIHEHESTLRSDIERTNKIILASQPLSSLQFHWEIRNFSENLESEVQKSSVDSTKFVEEQTGDMSNTGGNEISRMYVLYPFLMNAVRALKKQPPLPYQQHKDSSLLIMIALDEDQNVILPFGKLEPTVTWMGQNDVLPGKVEVLAGGISFCQETFSFNTKCYDELYNWEANKKISRELRNWPRLKISDETAGGKLFAIDWNLDPLTLERSIDTQTQKIKPTAKLPLKLRMAILFNIEDLPFLSANLAFPYATSIWEETALNESSINVEPISSTVELTANGDQAVKYRYRLKGVFERELLDDSNSEAGKADCLLLEFEWFSGH